MVMEGMFTCSGDVGSRYRRRISDDSRSISLTVGDAVEKKYEKERERQGQVMCEYVRRKQQEEGTEAATGNQYSFEHRNDN